MDGGGRDDEAGVSARGQLRDAVTSLQNLFALLRSPKVGPKAIASVLPEIRECCEPLGDGVDTLVASLAPRLPDSGPVEALGAFVRERAHDIAARVARAEKAGVDARSRLLLESTVEEVAPQIDAARGLFELLVAAVEETPADLDMADLLDEALAPSSNRGALWGRTATLGVTLPDHGTCPVTTRPRVAIPLVLVAVAHVSAASPPAGLRSMPHLHVGTVDGHVVIDVVANAHEATASLSDAVVLRIPHIVPPTAAILELVARTCGTRTELSPLGAQPTRARVTFG